MGSEGTLELLRNAADWLADASLTNEEVEFRALDAAGDAMLARRVLDWIPEVFGFVYASHHWKIELPKEFSVWDKYGDRKAFDLKVEPLFVPILELAMEAIHGEDLNKFDCVAGQSSICNAARKALEENVDLEGARFDSLEFNAIPAEQYEKSWWRGLLAKSGK